MDLGPIQSCKLKCNSSPQTWACNWTTRQPFQTHLISIFEIGPSMNQKLEIKINYQNKKQDFNM